MGEWGQGFEECSSRRQTGFAGKRKGLDVPQSAQADEVASGVHIESAMQDALTKQRLFGNVLNMRLSSGRGLII